LGPKISKCIKVWSDALCKSLMIEEFYI
jgi:hypothetical protein